MTKALRVIEAAGRDEPAVFTEDFRYTAPSPVSYFIEPEMSIVELPPTAEGEAPPKLASYKHLLERT